MDFSPFIDHQIEGMTVGSIIIKPELLDTVSVIISPEDFYYDLYRTVYMACVELHQTNRLDPQTIVGWVKHKNLENVSVEDVRSIVMCAAAPRMAKEYAEKVAMLSLKRKILKLSGDLDELVHNHEGRDMNALLTQVSGYVADLGSTSGSQLERATDYFDRYIQEKDSKEIVSSPKLGLTDIDSWMKGIGQSRLIVVAGRPGTGKTAFVLQSTHNISKQTFGAVPVFSLEMEKEELMDRIVSNVSGLPYSKVKDNDLTQDEKNERLLVKEKLNEQFYFDDKARMDIGYIIACCRKLKRQHGKLGAVAIDYLGLIDRNQRAGENTNDTIGRMTRELKQLSRELKCSIFLLVQMNREIEKRSTKRPVMSDLRDSGSIEQDADMIIFLYKDEEKSDQVMSHIDFIVAKGRQTGMRDFELAFIGGVQRMQTKAVYAPGRR